MPDEANERTCPHCQQAVSAPDGGGEIFTCPTCHQEFSVAPDDHATTRDDELDGIRIRHLATERRATYRARSYCVIAAIACVVVVLQLVWMTIRHIRLVGLGMRPSGYALFAILGIFAATYFIRRAKEFGEGSRRRLTSVITPPEFALLDNGSQQAKRLEDVH